MHLLQLFARGSVHTPGVSFPFMSSNVMVKYVDFAICFED